jgi:phosphoenolpyruvate synthase/pyruvate phosphate dikinase
MLCSFQEAINMPVSLVGSEAKKLSPSNQTGFIFTARAEEQFYLTNNLPEQLGTIFAGINPRRLDEDLLEVYCKKAVKLMLDSYLLEDFIAQSYLAIKNAKLEGGQMILRRPDSKLFEVAKDNRAALIALKRVWSHDWTFDAVVKRLDAKGKVGIDARATYIFAKI